MTRAFWVLLKREWAGLAGSPVAYVILTLMALFMLFVALGAAANLEQVSQLNLLQLIFRSLPIWFPILFIAPLLTMGMFSDEYKSGTIELLMTAPVTDLDVVLSKFFAAVSFFVILLLPAVINVLAFQWLTGHQVPIDWSHHVLTYLLLLLYGMFFCSLGLYISSLTKSQMLAAFLSFIIILLIFFIFLLRYRTTDPFWESFLEYISVIQHMILFSEGVVDSRPVVFYLSMTAFFVFMTQRSLAAHRLKT